MSNRYLNLPALAVAACLTAFGGQAALAASEIELFFPVPVDGQLARDMGTLIKRFNDAHPDIVATPVYTGSYDETLIKTNAAIKAGKPPAAVIMSANFLTDLVIEGQIQPFDDLIKASGQDRRSIHGAVLRGIASQRDRRSKGLRRAVPEFDAVALLQQGAVQGSGPRPRQAATELGPADCRRQEAHQARWRPRYPLGHHDALELRLRRLDFRSPDDVERRTLV